MDIKSMLFYCHEEGCSIFASASSVMNYIIVSYE